MIAAYDPVAIRNWLNLLHGQSVGWVWIGSTHDRFKGQAFDTARRGWAEQAARHVDQLDRTGTPGIYARTTTLTTNPEKGRGGDSDSLSLPGLAADLDIAGPGHAVIGCEGGSTCAHLTVTGKRKHSSRVLPLPPDREHAEAIVTESGLLDPSLWIHSGGGLYAWWLLEQPHPITDTARAGRFTARWQDVLRAAGERLGWHYGPVGDLSRILRIPGTVNRKPGMTEPVTCQVIDDTGRRYSLANLRDNLNDAIAAVPTPEPVNVTYRPARSIDDNNLRPGDDFEQRVDWREILEPHGWQLVRRIGQTRYWVRPGKERRAGQSASTGRNSDRDRLYVFTDGTELPQNKPLIKFAAYAHLAHGGSFTDATRELRRLGFGSRSRRERAT